MLWFDEAKDYGYLLTDGGEHDTPWSGPTEPRDTRG
jgi:hypothetical protein